MKYNGNFKLTFKGEPLFHVNKEKGVVTCLLNGTVLTPFAGAWYESYESPQVPEKGLRGVGFAKCSKEDKFDANRGKRIALARAENDCYLKATRYLAEQAGMLSKLIEGIDEFTDKAYGCCAHNEDYIDSISIETHPQYKNEITCPKRGREI